MKEESLPKVAKANNALFWKVTLILLGTISLSVGILKLGVFWTSYMLDIAGPAWGYVLIRGQYNSSSSTFFSAKFSPQLAALLSLGICFLVETGQYFKLYEATFDPYDYLAYCSLVIPLFIIDKWIIK